MSHYTIEDSFGDPYDHDPDYDAARARAQELADREGRIVYLRGPDIEGRLEVDPDVPEDWDDEETRRADYLLDQAKDHRGRL